MGHPIQFPLSYFQMKWKIDPEQEKNSGCASSDRQLDASLSAFCKN